LRPITILICIFFSLFASAQTLQLTLNQGRLTGSNGIVETANGDLTYSNTVLPPAIFFGAGKLGNLSSLSPTKGLIWSNDYRFPKTAFPFTLTNLPSGGGYLWSGVVFDNDRSMFLARLDADGNTLWSNQYGATGSVDTINQGMSHSVALSDGNFILAGGAGAFANDLRDNDLLMAKIDPLGAQIWAKRYCFSCAGNTETIFNDVAAAPDGGFLICGSYLDGAFSGQEILLIKTDSLGNTQWVKTYSDPQSASFSSNENGREVQYLPNGNIVLIANQEDLFVNSGAFLTEIKPNGDLIRTLRLRVKPAELYTLRLNKLLIEDNNTFTIAAGVKQDSTPNVSIEQNLLFQIRFDGTIPWQHNYNDEILQGFVTAESYVIATRSGGYAYMTNDAEGLDELFQVLVLTDAKGENGCQLPVDIKVEANYPLTQKTKTVTTLTCNAPIPFPLIKVAFPLNITMPTACFPADTVICLPDTLTLSVIGQNIDSHTWSTGDSSAQITVNSPGQYIVTVRNDAFCFQATDTITIAEVVDCQTPMNDTLMVGIPNAFTPNADMSNDSFRPVGQNFTIESLQIFNRWGNLIYQALGTNAAWDGRVDGTEAPMDAYVYVIRLIENGATKQYVGEVTLLR
jgi:gliding motility-associated-like protein